MQGTTGYDFLNLLNGIFVDRLGGYALRDTYVRFIGNSTPFAEVLHDSKRTILASSLSAELYTLSNALDRISEQHRLSRDFTRLSLFRALREVVACFPVYRTYIRPEEGTVRDEDRRRILDAVRVAKRRNPAMSPSFFDFIRSVLLLENPPGLSDESLAERQAVRLQIPAIHRSGHRQGTGRHGLLSLFSAGFAQRSRQRSDGHRHLGRAIPSAHGGASERLAPQSAGHRDPRHQAGRRRPRTAQRACRKSPTSGTRPSNVGRK